MCLAGPVSAVAYLATEALDALGVAVVTQEQMDALSDEDPPDADPSLYAIAAAGAALTGLDAETWVNTLRADYHDADAVLDAPNCGEWDCLHCWVNATGATG